MIYINRPVHFVVAIIGLKHTSVIQLRRFRNTCKVSKLDGHNSLSVIRTVWPCKGEHWKFLLLHFVLCCVSCSVCVGWFVTLTSGCTCQHPHLSRIIWINYMQLSSFARMLQIIKRPFLFVLLPTDCMNLVFTDPQWGVLLTTLPAWGADVWSPV